MNTSQVMSKSRQELREEAAANLWELTSTAFTDEFVRHPQDNGPLGKIAAQGGWKLTERILVGYGINGAVQSVFLSDPSNQAAIDGKIVDGTWLDGGAKRQRAIVALRDPMWTWGK